MPEQALAQTFEPLWLALQALSTELAHCPQAKPDWQAPWTPAEALQDIWYLQGQDGRATRNYYGVFQVDANQYQALNELNTLKKTFHQTLMAHRKALPTWQTALRRRLPSLNQALRRQGLARLQIKQLVRTQPLVDQPLAALQWSWYQSGRSIKTISRPEALKLLDALDPALPKVAHYRQLLAYLPEQQCLAQVQPQAPLMRGNFVFANGERQARNLALPVAYLGDIQDVACRWPPAQPLPKRQRAVRSDAQIEEQAYIPELRLHLYRC